jgi:hypothetical protein
MTVVSAFTNSRTVDPHDIGRGDGSLPKAGILSRCGRSCSRKVGRQRAEPATKEFIQRCRGIRSLFLGSGIRSDNGKLMSFSGGLVHNSRGQSKQVSMPREFQLTVAEKELTALRNPTFPKKSARARARGFPAVPSFACYLDGVVTLTSTFLLPPKNRPPKTNSAATTIMTKITSTATTPALPPPPLSPINFPPV